MKRIVVMLMVLMVQLGLGWAAQPVPRSLQQLLFKPELVMKNQQRLGITPEQRAYIVEQIQQTQSEFTALQWNLRSEVENLAVMIEQGESSEDALLEKLDLVLDLESRVKHAQFLLAIRIRNALNKDQLAKLDRLRREGNTNRRMINPRRRP